MTDYLLTPTHYVRARKIHLKRDDFYNEDGRACGGYLRAARALHKTVGGVAAAGYDEALYDALGETFGESSAFFTDDRFRYSWPRQKTNLMITPKATYAELMAHAKAKVQKVNGGIVNLSERWFVGLIAYASVQSIIHQCMNLRQLPFKRVVLLGATGLHATAVNFGLSTFGRECEIIVLDYNPHYNFKQNMKAQGTLPCPMHGLSIDPHTIAELAKPAAEFPNLGPLHTAACKIANEGDLVWIADRR